MSTEQIPPNPNNTTANLTGSEWNYTSIFSGKNGIIVILLILVVLSFVGVNLLNITGNFVENIVRIFGPIIQNLLALFGYSTGELINNSADVAASAAQLGVDIAKGTTHSIGDLLINASRGGMNESDKKRLDQALNSSNCSKNEDNEPTPSESSDSLQKPKSGWCYVGDYSGSRGCVSMDEHNKCMSGQVFHTQAACLAP